MLFLSVILFVNAAAPVAVGVGPGKPSVSASASPTERLQQLEGRVDQRVVASRGVSDEQKVAVNVHLQNLQNLRTEARAQVTELSRLGADVAVQTRRVEAALHSLQEALERGNVLFAP